MGAWSSPQRVITSPLFLITVLLEQRSRSKTNTTFRGSISDEGGWNVSLKYTLLLFVPPGNKRWRGMEGVEMLWLQTFGIRLRVLNWEICGAGPRAGFGSTIRLVGESCCAVTLLDCDGTMLQHQKGTESPLKFCWWNQPVYFFFTCCWSFFF